MINRLLLWFGGLRAEAVFLAIAAPFGLALLAANPPFQAPDEPMHYYRAFQLSEGSVVGQRQGASSGAVLPYIAIGVAYTEEISFHPERKMTAEIFRRKLNPPTADWSKEPRGHAHFPHTSIYPPVGYVPQAAAIAIGKAVHLGPLALLYLDRLAVLALSLCLGYAALQQLPVFRWTSLLLLLSPMSLYLMGSAAPDGMLIGSGFLLAALTIRFALAAEPPTRRELTLALALASALAFSKVVYLPLTVAAMVVAGCRLSSWRGRFALGLVYAATALLPIVVWSTFAAEFYAPGRTDIPIDPGLQARHVLAHPLQFAQLIVTTVREDGWWIYEWFVGTLGWGDTPMPKWYYTFFLVAFSGCALSEAGEAARLRTWQRAALLASAVAAALLIFLAQYATWNPPGSETKIDGICGRYFLPIAAFVVAAFPGLAALRRLRRFSPAISVNACAIGAFVSLCAVIVRFYVA